MKTIRTEEISSTGNLDFLIRFAQNARQFQAAILPVQPIDRCRHVSEIIPAVIKAVERLVR